MTQQIPNIEEENIPIRDININDFCITFSTVNGSGSITANMILLKTLFSMGIPVTGKNILPSNIQGLPTWFSLRLSKDGYSGRLEKDDIVVAMNPSAIERDLLYIVPGGVLFYSDEIVVPDIRNDIVMYPMPVKKMVKDADISQNLRGYVANMVYVGVLANILDIPLNIIRKVLYKQFEGKEKAIDINMGLVESAFDWAKKNLIKNDHYLVEKMNKNKEMILTTGNTAAALGAIYGGVQFVGWYPITPATSLTEEMNEYLPKLRKDPITDKNTYVVVQAEDELAAIGMAVGAGWAGLRAMTITSGPGLSLMAEYLGLAYFAEVPIVLWDVQRVGPSTGLPTRTSQGDINFVNFIGHGDTHYIILIPGGIEECFEFGWKAFDLAEKFQTPVIVLSDLDLGMNYWISHRFKYPDKQMDRGKVLWEQGLERMLNKLDGKWGRYLDIDGDSITYRTLPGNRHPKSGYFSRGTGHDEYAEYSEDPIIWEQNLGRIKRKIDGSKSFVPKEIINKMEGAKIGIISCGTTDDAIREARNQLAQLGILTDYLRIRSIPFTELLSSFIKEYNRVYVIELNQDGQLQQLITLENPEYAIRLIKLSHIDGMPLSAQWVKENIIEWERDK